MRLRDVRDVLTIDPNRRHEFVEHDTDTRCYVCGQVRSHDVHDEHYWRAGRALER